MNENDIIAGLGQRKQRLDPISARLLGEQLMRHQSELPTKFPQFDTMQLAPAFSFMNRGVSPRVGDIGSFPSKNISVRDNSMRDVLNEGAMEKRIAVETLAKGLGSRPYKGDKEINLKKAIGVPDIEKFAEGGIVTRPTVGLLGEAGPEAVIPLSSEQQAQMTHKPQGFVQTPIIPQLLNRAQNLNQTLGQLMTGQVDPASREGIEKITPIMAGLTGYGFMGAAPEGAAANVILGPRLKSPWSDKNAVMHDLIDSRTKERMGSLVGKIQSVNKKDPNSPKELYVDWIGASPPDNIPITATRREYSAANTLGMKEIKELLKDIKQKYPEVSSLGGYRVSGARGESQGPETVSVPLKPGGLFKTDRPDLQMPTQEHAAEMERSIQNIVNNPNQSLDRRLRALGRPNQSPVRQPEEEAAFTQNVIRGLGQ